MGMGYWIVYAFQALAIVVLFFELIYAFFQKPSRLQTDILLLGFATLIMMAGYMVEIVATDVDAAIIGAAVSYIGKPFTMCASFFFIATYCGYHVSRKLRVALAIYSALIPIIVFTNHYHYLYYATVDYTTDAVFSHLQLTHGPLYYVYMVSIFAYTLADLVLALIEVKRSKTRFEKASVMWIFAMIGTGILGYILYLLGWTGGYDSTMAGVTVGVFILFLLFVRYRIFDVVGFAKENALNNAVAGLLVLDRRNRVAYSNKLMDEMTASAFSIGQLQEFANGTHVTYNERTYLIKKNPIMNRDEEMGLIYELDDVTDSYAYAARLEKDVEERTREIVHMQRSVIGGIANVVEARNGETGSHIIRTAQYVSLLATQLQKTGVHTDVLTDEYIKRLVDAAPLHDLGKITVSDAILMKPGKLTPEEFDAMKLHAAAGVDIIEKVMKGVESEAYVNCAEEVAHYHHEKWDGSGYPCGLSGEDIPLSARIMAVADVYDALRSDRCYKKAMDKETARGIISEGSGHHFDPAVVKAFFDCLNEIEAVC